MTARRAVPARTAAAEAPQKSFSLISDEKLIALYTAMLQCRITAEWAHAAHRKAGHPATHAIHGREAAIAGVMVDLGAGDALSTTPRDQVAGTLKGISPRILLPADLARPAHRNSTSSAQPADPTAIGVIPPALSTSAQLLTACGAAWGQQTRAEGKVTAIFCGDTHPLPHLWHEALALAGRHQLPVLFVCQHAPAPAEAEAHSEQLAALAKTHRVPAITVDGSDAVAVYRVAFESLSRARQGRGPTLIECLATPSAQDPLLNMESYLARKGLFHAQLRQQIARKLRKQLRAGA